MSARAFDTVCVRAIVSYSGTSHPHRAAQLGCGWWGRKGLMPSPLLSLRKCMARSWMINTR